MSVIDWMIVLIFFAYIMWDGIRLNKNNRTLDDLLLAGRKMPWWAIGISVLATQASAITFIGTTGLAYMQDMQFVQIYLGLPIAMIILCLTLVPLYHRLKVYTAYEVLENRFGLKVRLLTSLLFLLSRGLALGVTIAAPSYVLSLILGIPLNVTMMIIGLSATIYTMIGGMAGVIRTDIKQMILMLIGLCFCFGWIVWQLPSEVSFNGSLKIAGALGKLDTIDFNFNPSEKYNIWSGIIAGLFLMLSYFGCDQSQVQRYLTASSLKDARSSLMMVALTKIPFMFFILLIGALLYVFFIFEKPPLLFSNYTPATEKILKLNESQEGVFDERKRLAYEFLENPEPRGAEQLLEADQRWDANRTMALSEINTHTGYKRDDTNYVLPYFILNYMPIGVIGLIIAAIMAAALSSIDSGLNSLATASVMDWYARLFKRKMPDTFYLKASRYLTGFWGIFALSFALLLGETESIIELINKIGSYFYGAILGVFILLGVSQANGSGAFYGLLAGLASVAVLDNLYYDFASESYRVLFLDVNNSCPMGFQKSIGYLWLNPIGCGVVVAVGYLVSLLSFSKNNSNHGDSTTQ